MIWRFGPDSVARSFEPYSEAEVGRHRTQPLVEVEALRAELLRALDAQTSGGAPDEPGSVY